MEAPRYCTALEMDECSTVPADSPPQRPGREGGLNIRLVGILTPQSPWIYRREGRQAVLSSLLLLFSVVMEP